MPPIAGSAHRAIAVGLAAVLCTTSTTVSAQQSGREPTLADGKLIAIDACTVAPLEQLRFLVAANLARLTQPTRARNGSRIAVRSLGIDGATCAPFRTSLQAQLTLFTTRSGAPDSAVTALRFTAEWAAQARFRDAAKARSSATLDAATLCVRDVEVTRPEPRSGAQVDRSMIRAPLIEALQHQCLEITSLVYLFLERGGTLPPL